MLFWFRLIISDPCLFHLIVILNPALSCSKSLLSFSVDKVTTGGYNFVAFVGLSIAATAGSASGFASLVASIINAQFVRPC